VLLKAKEIAAESAEWQALKTAGEQVLKEREANRNKEVLKQYVETRKPPDTAA
jgi:hypothetical protein